MLKCNVKKSVMAYVHIGIT